MVAKLLLGLHSSQGQLIGGSVRQALLTDLRELICIIVLLLVIVITTITIIFGLIWFTSLPCFQDGWSSLDAWGLSRTTRTINRRPGRLIDPGRVPWSSPIYGELIYHIYYIVTQTNIHTLIYYMFWALDRSVGHLPGCCRALSCLAGCC